MKLEKELIREIMLALEASEHDPRFVLKTEIEGDSKKFSYHVQLLDEAGLIQAANHSIMGPGGYQWKPKRLTYRGHEFLDTIRDEEVWRRTKAGVTKIGGASIELLWEIGKAFGKQVAQEKLGITLG